MKNQSLAKQIIKKVAGAVWASWIIGGLCLAGAEGPGHGVDPINLAGLGMFLSGCLATRVHDKVVKR